MHATTEQILEAFQNLTETEMLALHKFASKVIRAHPDLPEIYSEPLDLIHEALHRSLVGRRNWPVNLAFTLHMVQTIRSVLGHDRKRIHNRADRMVSIADGSELGSSAAGWPSLDEQAMAFEQIGLARKMAERARAGMTGDEVAQDVLEGMLAGLSPKETCQHYGIAAREFDAARHRVMRKLREGRMH